MSITVTDKSAAAYRAQAARRAQEAEDFAADLDDIYKSFAAYRRGLGSYKWTVAAASGIGLLLAIGLMVGGVV